MEDQTNNNKRVFNFYGEVEIPKSLLYFVSRNEQRLLEMQPYLQIKRF